MKKIIVLSIFCATCYSVNAQKVAIANVPTDVRKAFQKKYPDVAATWEKEGANFEVNFKQNGAEMSAIINSKGDILETETSMKAAALPTEAMSYLKSHYSNKPVKEASKITKADGTLTFEAEVAGWDIIFDKDGRFLEEIAKEKNEKD